MEKEDKTKKPKNGVLDELNKQKLGSLLLDSDDEIVIHEGKCSIRTKNKNLKLLLCDVVIHTDQSNVDYINQDACEEPPKEKNDLTPQQHYEFLYGILDDLKERLILQKQCVSELKAENEKVRRHLVRKDREAVPKKRTRRST